jgi:hypothetical protein
VLLKSHCSLSALRKRSRSPTPDDPITQASSHGRGVSRTYEMGDTTKYHDDEDPFDWLVFCSSCGAYTEPGPDGKPTCNHGYENAPASSPAGHRER